MEPRRLARFKKLHAALHDAKNTDAMWEAYQEIRKVPQDFELLKQDILRLLVIYFKDSVAPSLNEIGVHWKRQTSGQTCFARIVAVLDDKRIMTGEFTRWDYSDIMWALNGLERYEESLQEFERVRSGKLKVDPILLNHAVRAWGGLGQLDKAVEAIRLARINDDAKASEYTLGYLIQQYLLTGRRSKAVDFWHELTVDNTPESIETMNGILRACVSVQDNAFAQMVYDSLPRLKIESDLKSLNLMLSLAVAEIRHPEERSQFLWTIQDKIAASDKPLFDKSILDSIKVSFSKKGDADGAIMVHQLMTNYGFRPGVAEHNEILHCYARLEQMDKAIDWLQEMRRSGIRPDRCSYVLLLQSYSRQRKPRETEALFRQMVSDGIEPDLAACNFLLLAYEQAKMNRRCLQLYKTMFRDHSIGVDLFTFSCMFNAVFHNDKALLEGSEGLGSQGPMKNDIEFLGKISEPIGPIANAPDQAQITLENEGSQVVGPPEGTPVRLQTPNYVRYQFEGATSTTEYLDPRTLFRDMLIVGIRPSRSLYSNILRAFLEQNDYAGAAVATRALVDYHVLKPTPKMNAIIVTWVYQKLHRRGSSNKEDAVTKIELSKLISMMRRTRGLIDMLEKIVTVERWWGEDISDETYSTSTLAPPAGSATKAGNHKSVNRKNFPVEGQEDLIAKATMEMGGDVVDLTSKSVLAGSSWSTSEDNLVNIDLKDFERWYRSYADRTTQAQAIKATSPSPQLT
ncbi:hypothetical protein BGZ58_007653 [Dissophora ornata]|nr:hypothetical protein BGZ58_007653 [Dissophora ornata]